MRLKIIRLVIIILFALVASELIYVQAVRGFYYFKLSKNNRIRVVPLEGERGRILDRSGIVLADNEASYDLMIAPQDLRNRQELFAFLEKTLQVDAEKLWDTYATKKTAPFVPVVIFKNLSRETAIILEENRYRFPSLIIQQSYKRIYPLYNNSAHLLGYVSKMSRLQMEKFKEYGYSPESMIGTTGIEEYYDLDLRGEEGGLQLEVNSRGQQVRLLSLKEANNGQDLTLTIDSHLQNAAMQLLGESRGAIIVMDINDGEILSLTSSPSYDPNVFIDNVSRKVSPLFSDPSAPLLDRATKASFSPGSIFKIPLALGALETKKINFSTRFFCPGYYELGGKIFRCVHEHGSQDLIEAIAHSCNVYFFHLGLALQSQLIEHYAKLFGLGDKTHIDLPFEKSGRIPTPRQNFLSGRRWYTGDTLNIAIGQGDVLTTPMQLVRMMATVARNGAQVQPHLIKSIGGRSFDHYFSEEQINFNKEIFAPVLRGLRSAVTMDSGTAHLLDLSGIYVAGKTGTAQSSAGKEDHAWFVGYAKGNDRDLAFCVFLEHGGSSHNAVAIAQQLLSYMTSQGIL